MIDLRATVDGIAALQLPSGMIPWYPGGHCDPWNHVETAMALSVGGRRREAERAYRWLNDVQNRDGSWFNYYVEGGISDYRLDTNVVAYIAVGVWHHYLVTGDNDFLAAMWPTVERALDFVVRLQQSTGEVLWCIEPDLTPGRFALLTGSSSIYLSLRCGVALGDRLGKQRPDWELAAGRLRHAIAYAPERFEPKDRWAMDWYYPVLCGAVTGAAAHARMAERWDEFVMEG
ncbi:MAG: prenyltransferase, partial [Actinobacteria bacterium]|nr:prenyltransferase [Actinomycetota bacterium]